MTTLDINYNPYKMKTVVLIDGQDVFTDPYHLKIQEFINNGIPLQTWVERMEHKNWKGLLSHLVPSDEKAIVEVNFKGRKIDYDDLMRSLNIQAKKRNPKYPVVIKEGIVKTVLDDQKLLKDIDYVVKELLSDKFKQIVEGINEKTSVYKKYQELEQHYEEVKDAEFRVVVAGTYSSGKSTLINALIGHNVLPEADQTTTTKVCKVVHSRTVGSNIQLKAYNDAGEILVDEVFSSDAECNERFEQISPKGSKTTNPQGIVEIQLLMDLSHLYPRTNNGCEDKFKLVIVDTPGTDSGNSIELNDNGSVLVNHEQKVAIDAVNSENKEMVLICVDARRAEQASIGELLRHIHEENTIADNSFNDRFVFVMNRSDEISADSSLTDLKVRFSNYITSTEKWGIKNATLTPKIMMTSAKFQKIVNDGIAELDADEICDSKIDKLYNEFNMYKKQVVKFENENYTLLKHCDVPEYLRNEITNDYNSAVVDKRYGDAVSIQTGVPCISRSIQDYIERYAIPFKVRALLSTFEDILSVISNITNSQHTRLKEISEKLGESQDKRKVVEEERRKSEERESDLNNLNAEIDDITLELKDYNSGIDVDATIERFDDIFDGNETIVTISSGRRVNADEFQRIASQMNVFFDELQRSLGIEYNKNAERCQKDINAIIEKLNKISERLKENKNLKELSKLSLEQTEFEKGKEYLKKISTTSNEVKRKTSYFGLDFWGIVRNFFSNLFGGKKETVVWYNLDDLWKNLSNFQRSFKLQCRTMMDDINNKIEEAKSTAIRNSEKLKTDLQHTHDDLKRQEKELDELLNNKQDFENTIMQIEEDKIYIDNLIQVIKEVSDNVSEEVEK